MLPSSCLLQSMFGQFVQKQEAIPRYFNARKDSRIRIRHHTLAFSCVHDHAPHSIIYQVLLLPSLPTPWQLQYRYPGSSLPTLNEKATDVEPQSANARPPTMQPAYQRLLLLLDHSRRLDLSTLQEVQPFSAITDQRRDLHTILVFFLACDSCPDGL